MIQSENWDFSFIFIFRHSWEPKGELKFFYLCSADMET